MEATEASRRTWLSRVGPIALIVVLLLGATFAGFHLARRTERGSAESLFGLAAEERFASIQSQLENAGDPIEALAAFWYASEFVKPDEFSEFTTPFLSKRDDIEAIEWVPRVKDVDRREVEGLARESVDPEYRITEMNAQGDLVDASRRPEYFPVFYVRPFHSNRLVIGFDLASDPERKRTLEAAAERGTLLSTRVVHLVQDVGDRASDRRDAFLTVIPIYDGVPLPTTVEERRRRLAGFAVGVLRFQPIVDRALKPFEETGVAHLALYRRGTDGQDTPVHVQLAKDESAEVVPPSPEAFARSDYVKSFDALGGSWEVRAVPIEALASAKPGILSLGVLLVGLAGSAALAIWFTGHERRTRKLTATNVALEREIEERRRAEEARESMQRQILETQKLESLGVLAGGIAHDFNNLLTGIMGNAGLALHYVVSTSPARRPLEQVVAASERAALLTRQLLSYAGKGTVEVRPLDLPAQIKDLAPLITASISKKVALNLDLEQGVPPIEADPAQIHQLVMNLVLNGAEACEESPGEVRVSVRSAVTPSSEETDPGMRPPRPGAWVVLEVTDTGRGMDRDTIDKIFDPFFTTKFAGRGLGLAAAQGIVRAHGAAMRVRSKPGRGSTFRVLFPASDRPVPDTRRAPITGALAADRLILVVDDEPVVRDLARATLEGAGYRVLTAADGRRGVEMFRENAETIAAVLLDVTMPEMGGDEARREIRTIRADVPVILTSGYGEMGVVIVESNDEPVAFLEKPYLPSQLVATVRNVTGRGTPAEGT